MFKLPSSLDREAAYGKWFVCLETCLKEVYDKPVSQRFSRALGGSANEFQVFPVVLSMFTCVPFCGTRVESFLFAMIFIYSWAMSYFYVHCNRCSFSDDLKMTDMLSAVITGSQLSFQN